MMSGRGSGPTCWVRDTNNNYIKYNRDDVQVIMRDRQVFPS